MVSIRSREYTECNEENTTFWKKKLEDVKIILFDWDGTVNRDGLKHYAAKHDLVNHFNLDAKYGITPQKLYRYEGVDTSKLNGSQARKTGWQYIREGYPQISIFKRFFIYIYYELAYFLNSSKNDYLICGSTDSLWELKKRGYILGVATNKDSYIVKRQLEISNLKGIFTSILGSDKVMNMKPHPEMMLKNLGIINRKLGTKYQPKNVLMVGDGIKDDILGGLRAGNWTCLVHAPNDALNEKPDSELPHINLETIKDLPKFLN